MYVIYLNKICLNLKFVNLGASTLHTELGIHN